MVQMNKIAMQDQGATAGNSFGKQRGLNRDESLSLIMSPKGMHGAAANLDASNIEVLNKI